MANIVAQLNELESPSTNGRRSRQLIIDACEVINKNGTNAKTLQGYDESYFVANEEFRLKTYNYLRRIGLVANLNTVVDTKGNKTVLTESYASGYVTTPFDTSKDKKKSKSTSSADFDVTFATSGAVYNKLMYSDLSSLRDYINN